MELDEVSILIPDRRYLEGYRFVVDNLDLT